MKVYELKKGDKILYNENLIIFEEIRGEKAIFYNEWGEEFIFPDFFSIDEIGELIDRQKQYNKKHPTLF